MGGVPKKDRQLSLRVAATDLVLFRQAAAKAWPGAPLSTASIVVTLAKMKAIEIVDNKPSKHDK